MPKKKLTKIQVKKTLAQIAKLESKLLIDKIEQPDSFVPIGITKMMERANNSRAAIRRVK